MKAIEAYQASKLKVRVRDRDFAIVKWTSPSNGSHNGPILITIDSGCAVEIGWDGSFSDCFPAIADHYSPMEMDKEGLRLNVGQLINQLVKTI